MGWLLKFIAIKMIHGAQRSRVVKFKIKKDERRSFLRIPSG